MSVKALVDFVLEKVAIDGEEGTSVQDLFKYVEEFYRAVRMEKWDLQGLVASDGRRPAQKLNTDDAPAVEKRTSDTVAKPGKGGKKKENVSTADLWGKPNVKAEFQDHIWEELKKEKDFIMGLEDRARELSLKEVVERLKKGNEEEKKLRVYTTVHRRWVVLTGHAPDSKRVRYIVPNALYKCLEEIARHGEKGIIQPELTKLTGQDKRSIAGRTSQLAELGYIEKIGVLVTSMNTSKLTLSKFAAQRDYKLALEEMQKGKIDTVKSTFTGDVIYSAELVRAIMHELKQAKSGVLLRHDLKIKLGMHKSMFHSRTLSRLLRRVECLGVWRRIKVPLSINRTVRNKDTPEHGIVEKCHARCLKYLRDLTEEDWKMIGNSTRPAITVEEDDQDDGADSEAEGGKEAKQLDAEAAKQLATTAADAVAEESRQLPIWTPDLPLPNLVYHAIDKTGQEGLSSMELMAKIIGGFYYRPMDQVLHRLTDLPSKSQPPGYINLAIIRETSISHRQTHYRYFTYGAHQELVKQGLASDPWEVKAKVKMKGVKLGSGPAVETPISQLDSNGFPIPDKSRLLHGTGAATLKESQIAVKSKENSEIYTNQCSIKVGPDGKEHVDWTNIGRGKGRPRKYEKGKEPYLAAKRRREALGLPPSNKGRPKGTKNSKSKKNSAQPTTQAVATAEEPLPDGTQKPSEVARSPEVETTQALTPDPVQPPSIAMETTTQTPATPASQNDRSPPPNDSTTNMSPPLSMDRAPAAAQFASVVTPVPKRRGRPPKKPAPETPTNAQSVSTSNTPVTPLTRLTRKRKSVTSATPTTRQSKRVRTITDFFSPAPSFTSVNDTQKTPDQTSVEESTHQDANNALTLTEISEVGQINPTPASVKKRSSRNTPTKRTYKRRKQAEDVDETLAEEQTTNPDRASVPTATDEQEILNPAINDISMEDAHPSAIQKDTGEAAQSQDEDIPASVEPPKTHQIDGTTVEIEPVEPPEQNTYNLMGGMLALSRQQVVLDLVKEFGGCFPGGLELRHAFNKRYKKKNPKAGDSDRRLVRSVVQSLQYKGKVNQITFTFMNSKQVPCTKKIVVDIGLALDDPVVERMTRDIIAADGNMWFPPGTDLPADIAERMAQPSGKMQGCQEVMVEGVQFDRLYPAPMELLKKKRAERAAMRAKQKTDKQEERTRARQERAIRRALVAQRSEAPAPLFTEEQKAEAAKRNATLKQQTAMWRLNKRFSSRVIAGEQEYGGDSSLPKSIWWNEFVARHDDTETFLRGVKDVRKWENLITEADGIDELTEGVRGADQLVMVNHFGPHIEGSFQPGSVDLDKPRNLSKRAAKKLFEMPALKEPAPKTVRRQRRPRPPTRRSMAMKAIHDQMTLEMADDGADIPTRKEQAHRNCYTIPREDEDTLLVAVIIVRMLFGDRDRKIRWDLVQKALPQHPMSNLRGRWPRVRDTYRKYLKRIETEFENLYLDAYERGELPPIDLARPSKFDVPLHVNWFRKSFTMPEFDSSIELPASRTVFGDLYALAEEKTNYWRFDYHNIHNTMGARANHFACYAYDIPITKPAEGISDVDYAKSIIKANIVTAPESYNPQKAFNILHALPEEAVDEAFYSLSVSKIITHKKEHTRAAPGRNYELSEKFHLSVKRPMETKHFAQAVKFERGLAAKFEQDGEAEVEVSHMVNDGAVAAIFDLLEDGRIKLEKLGHQADKWGLIEGYETRSMDRELVNFKVLVKKGENWKRRMLNPLPPIPGVPSSLSEVDTNTERDSATVAKDTTVTSGEITASGAHSGSFTVSADSICTSVPQTSHTNDAAGRSSQVGSAALPSLPTSTAMVSDAPLITEASSAKVPVPVWVDINNCPIPGMWLKIATAVLCTVTMQSGIGPRGLVDMLAPGLTKREVEMVLEWLKQRGAVMRRSPIYSIMESGEDTREAIVHSVRDAKGVEDEMLGYYSCPGYYLALEGFNVVLG